MTICLRQTHKLNDAELKRWRRLPPLPHLAVKFWKEAALFRGLDPDTVISKSPTFTALPVGHGKHWCWPIPLQCKRRPFYKDD